MALANPAIDHVLKSEGGYVNHPSDPGGATKYGITQRTLNRYMALRGEETYNVAFLTVSTARDIYKELYWDLLWLDHAKHQKIALCVFSIGVNQGLQVVVKRSQIVSNYLRHNLAVDGIMGPKTLSALNAVGPVSFCDEFLSHTMHYYCSIVERSPSRTVFLEGWHNRVWSLRRQVARR